MSAEVRQVVLGELRGDVALQDVASSGEQLKNTLLRAFADSASRSSRGSWPEMLMGGDDRQPVAAGLGQHVAHRPRQGEEVLRLVQVEGGVPAGVWPFGLGR